nr:MAG TPA: hypothetical protein [Caudoviricetes sp.]DAY39318.1 MAG TPA: hypothetical protein [Caudoviricetes sp.]
MLCVSVLFLYYYYRLTGYRDTAPLAVLRTELT